MMFRLVLASALVLWIAVATTPAGAQSVGSGPTFTSGERTVVRQWIKRQRPVAVGGTLTVGEPLPMDVESYPVPKDWGRSAAHYRYVHSGKRVYFVDPKSGRVVLMMN